MKVLNLSEEEQLQGLLNTGPFVIVGVGNPLRGDDGVGSFIAQHLSQKHPEWVIDAGTVPENFLGLLLEKKPSVCLFVDAVNFGGAPGHWQLMPLAHLMDKLPSTHTLSLNLLGQILEEEGIECWMLAIQPQQIAFGAPLSPAVHEAMSAIIALFETALAKSLYRFSEARKESRGSVL